MQTLIEEAITYVQTLFAGNADGHGADHTLRVYHNALLLLQAEPGANRLAVCLGALLHDADDPKLFQTVGNANARAFLEGRGLERDTVEWICDIINGVSFSKNRDKKPQTLEGQIVQDADRLDALGAIGIGRTFAYGGGHGRPLASSVVHFYEKLLLLKDCMNTPMARAMAEERHAFMVEFLRHWERETGTAPGGEA